MFRPDRSPDEARAAEHYWVEPISLGQLYYSPVLNLLAGANLQEDNHAILTALLRLALKKLTVPGSLFHDLRKLYQSPTDEVMKKTVAKGETKTET